MSVIHLAGGCFWGLEKAFQDLPGVISTECGYANGDPHFVPDYMLVCSGRYGYREAVRVEYDPSEVSLGDLLAAFFYLIDPTQERRQGNDVGIQYQTGVYWSDPGTEDIVRRVFAEQSSIYPEFHTEMGPLTFWSPAEPYHQRYLDRNPGGYCHIPVWKMDALKELMAVRRRFRPFVQL
ncbi:MAG: peptide-methionine (S)-S-oxide reductase MsrA [Thermoplasmata archaeon]|nr:peptide-methionine (S)-S-oxide reductase MsrA [Thermoplasmata archaeon]